MMKRRIVTGLIVLGVGLFAGCGEADEKDAGSPKRRTEEKGNKEEGKKPGSANAEKPGKKPAQESNEEANQGEEPTTPVDDRTECERAWDEYVAHNEEGEFLEYRTITKGAAFEVEMTSKQEVLESTDEQVSWKYTTTHSAGTTETESTILKPQFIEGCEGDANEPDEEGDETIEVPAGTFDTQWQKRRLEQAGMVSNTTSYTTELDSGETILVKSITEVEGDNPTSTVMELMATNKE